MNNERAILTLLKCGWILISSQIPPKTCLQYSVYLEEGLDEINIDIKALESLRDKGLIQGIEYSYPYNQYILTERGTPLIEKKNSKRVEGKMLRFLKLIRAIFKEEVSK